MTTDDLVVPLPGFGQRLELAQIVARECAETLVGQRSGAWLEVAHALIAPIAHGIARRVEDYDRALSDGWAGSGAGWIVERETGGLQVEGREHVPARGPLLVVANHPGLSDAVALLATLGRDDAWIVAADYPFLRALRHARRRFVFVSTDQALRPSTVRGIAARLREGAAVMLFPAGRLEVDPALSQEAALGSLALWSRSIDLLARLVPDTLVLPAVLCGVVSRAALDHPLARRRRSAAERQRMASLLQLAFPAYQRDRVRLAFAAPIAARSDIYAATLTAVASLIQAA